MKISNFNKGIIFTSLGSFWWGVIGVIYFQYFSFVGHIELVIHRCLWTALMLILTTTFLSKWEILFKIFKDSTKIFVLFITGFLIFANWAVWIYAVATNQIINASFGYFIMPILSVLFGYIFFKEILNKRASEVIADYIDLTNNLLKKHKKLVKKNLATPATKGSIWWNEILIYGAKIKEIFVMSRVAKDLDWSTTERDKLEKLASLATGNDPITVGTPSKYRKWYTDRKGVFDDI